MSLLTGSPDNITGIRLREKSCLKKFSNKFILNLQKRTGSGSAIIKNSGSESALNQCESETLPGTKTLFRSI
jgi:hypothetical protein